MRTPLQGVRVLDLSHAAAQALGITPPASALRITA